MTVSQTQTSHTHRRACSRQDVYLPRVRAGLAGNLSKSSNAVTVTLPGEIAAPTKPVVTVTDVGPTHVSLAWSSTDNGPIILVHHLYRRRAGRQNELEIGNFHLRQGMVPTYCDPINQDTTYAFTVRARELTATNRR